jgi:hypothetical protein
MQAIVDEIFNEDMAKEWLEDYIKWNDDLKDFIEAAVHPVIEKKILDILKKI